jgi:type II secretory pathway component GspD/PulD (secretin)
MSINSVFKRAYGIPEDDDVLFRIKSADLENKTIKKSCSLEQRVIGFFQAGSNSTINTLRYLIPAAAVATAGGEPEDNVAVVYDYPLRIKRIRYIIGTNTKNAITNISLRVDKADLVQSMLAIQPATNSSFDSGVLNVDLPAGTKINWKWDTSLSSSGGITIIFHAAYEMALV